MQEELTAEMHLDFIGDEVSKKDYYIFCAYGATRRGISLDDACKRYGLSVSEYKENIDRVLNDPSW